MLIAPLIDTSGSLYNYLQKINATFFGPMLAVILLGFLTTHVSAFSAKLSLVVGPGIFYLLVFGFWSQDVDITPWPHARKLGASISILTLLFYILLAQ